MEKLISLENISKIFTLSKKQQRINKSSENKVVACDNISFDVRKNEIFGLLGPNGAGKTTALRMIATLIKPDSGKITVNNLDIKRAEEIKKQIAFLTNDLKLDEQFTPNYLFNFFSTLHDIEPEIAQKRKKELFRRFGIDRFAEVKIKDLSQGMKQKISIAVSLVNDPEIIIFDEPTNGLDIITARTVTDYLLELKQQGKTIILSTHIMSLIEKLCDRVAIIIDGKVALIDDVATLLAKNNDIDELFFNLYRQYGRHQE